MKFCQLKLANLIFSNHSRHKPLEQHFKKTTILFHKKTTTQTVNYSPYLVHPGLAGLCMVAKHWSFVNWNKQTPTITWHEPSEQHFKKTLLFFFHKKNCQLFIIMSYLAHAGLAGLCMVSNEVMLTETSKLGINQQSFDMGRQNITSNRLYLQKNTVIIMLYLAHAELVWYIWLTYLKGDQRKEGVLCDSICSQCKGIAWRWPFGWPVITHQPSTASHIVQ